MSHTDLSSSNAHESCDPAPPASAARPDQPSADRCRDEGRIAVGAGFGLLDEQPVLAEGHLESLPRGSINRQVFILALPMLGEQIGNFMVMFVDTWLAGRVAMEATAAVGAGSYMGWFVSLALSLVGTGAAALVARSFGARDTATAKRGLHQALILAVVLGIVVTGAGYFGSPAMAWLFGLSDQANVLLIQYIRVDCLGYGVFSLFLVGSGIIRAAGDMRTPMLIMIAVNAVNIVVSSALVYGWLGPEMGVTGIAIGTVVARLLGGLLMIIVLIRGVRGLRIERRLLAYDAPIMRRILNIGLPAAADTGLLWVAHMAFITAVAHSATGAYAVANFAAHTIALRMEAISFLPAVAWMTAASTMVGQYLGANRPDDAARSGHRAALQCAALTGLIGVFFFFYSEPIFAFMSKDPLVVEVGAPAFRLMAFIQPLLGMAIVYIGALRGAGDTRTTLLFQIIGGILLRVPFAWFFGVYLGGGLLGCWVGMWMDNIAKFLCGWLRFLHGGWKKLEV
jgi:putative MATE family efflux protein